jgi:hypothetical protein
MRARSARQERLTSAYRDSTSTFGGGDAAQSSRDPSATAAPVVGGIGQGSNVEIGCFNFRL